MAAAPEIVSHLALSKLALAQLFAAEQPALLRFLTRLTRCAVRAEDLAQMAWLRLHAALQRGACPTGDECELRAYLFTVARNAYLDEFTRKHEALKTRCCDPAELDPLLSQARSAPSAEDEVAREQAAVVVRRAIDTLPASQRQVVLLWASGVSLKDMARTCAAPLDTVLSRKKYAVARMRRLPELQSLHASDGAGGRAPGQSLGSLADA